MGIGGIGIWQLLIILVIVFMLFGTKRLKGLGGDLGSAIKGFKKAVGEDQVKDTTQVEDQTSNVEKVIDVQAEKVETENTEKK